MGQIHHHQDQWDMQCSESQRWLFESTISVAVVHDDAWGARPPLGAQGWLRWRGRASAIISEYEWGADTHGLVVDSWKVWYMCTV